MNGLTSLAESRDGKGEMCVRIGNKLKTRTTSEQQNNKNMTGKANVSDPSASQANSQAGE